MRPLRQLSFWLRTLLRHNDKQDNLNEEVAIHIEMLTEDFVCQGMSPLAARKAALIEFGGIERVKEDCRDSWGVRLIADTYRDVLYGLRQLRKHKGFASITILTLCLCLAANTAIFSLMYNMFIHPHNFAEPDRTTMIGMKWKKSSYGDAVLLMSPRRFLEIKEAATSYDSMGLFEPGKASDLYLNSGLFNTRYGKISPGIWEVAGVNPILGQVYTQESLDAGDYNVVVLSHRFWEHHFQNNGSEAIGSTIRLDDTTYKIVAVMPENFHLTLYDYDFWTPYVFGQWAKSESSRNNNNYFHFARLKDGVTLEQARSELDNIYVNTPEHIIETGVPLDLDEESYGITLAKDYGPQIVPVIAVAFWSIQGAVATVLIIGCFNVGGLILVRNYHRLGELDMRYALGAPKGRLYRQLITETVLLLLIAGILCVPLAHGMLGLMNNVILQHVPFGLPIDIGLPVIAPIFILLFLCGIVFGSLPAWSVIRNGLGKERKFSNRSSSSSSGIRWMQNSFVVGLISISIILLVAAGAFFRNVSNTMNQDFGYDTNNRIFANITLPKYLYDSRTEIDSFRQLALKKLSEIPGIESVAFTSSHPLSDASNETSFEVEGFQPGPEDRDPHGNLYIVSNDYFSTTGIKLVSGRVFHPSDAAPNADPVMVVSESVAKDHLQDREPIGATIKWRGNNYKIIGLVNDTIDYPFYSKEPRHTVYRYDAKYPYEYREFAFALKVAPNAPLPIAAVENAIAEIDPNLTRVKVVSSGDVLNKSILVHLLTAEITLCLSVVAIALSLLGLYGVMSYIVSQQQRETAIRIALGASAALIARRLYWWSGRLAGIGIVIGISLSYALTRFAASILPAEVQMAGFDTFAITALLIAITAIASTYLPARRATRIDPCVALKAE